MTDIRKLPRNLRRAAAKAIELESRRYPDALAQIPCDEWPPISKRGVGPMEIWRSKHFFLQVYPFSDDVERLSINRSEVKEDGNWNDQITWEDLQRLKSECGRGEFDAVEVFPADTDIVNVANMRHLWVMKHHNLKFIWRNNKSKDLLCPPQSSP